MYDGTPCVVQLTAGRSSHVLPVVGAAVGAHGGAVGAVGAPAEGQVQLAGVQAEVQLVGPAQEVGDLQPPPLPPPHQGRAIRFPSETEAGRHLAGSRTRKQPASCLCARTAISAIASAPSTG